MPTTYIDGVSVRCGCRPRSGERMDQRRCGQPRGEDAWQYHFRRTRIWAENEDDTNMSTLDGMVNSLHGQHNRWATKPCLGSRDIQYKITVQWNLVRFSPYTLNSSAEVDERSKRGREICSLQETNPDSCCLNRSLSFSRYIMRSSLAWCGRSRRKHGRSSQDWIMGRVRLVLRL